VESADRRYNPRGPDITVTEPHRSLVLQTPPSTEAAIPDMLFERAP
jgi:hypothetical protein